MSRSPHYYNKLPHRCLALRQSNLCRAAHSQTPEAVSSRLPGCHWLARRTKPNKQTIRIQTEQQTFCVSLPICDRKEEYMFYFPTKPQWHHRCLKKLIYTEDERLLHLEYEATFGGAFASSGAATQDSARQSSRQAPLQHLQRRLKALQAPPTAEPPTPPPPRCSTEEEGESEGESTCVCLCVCEFVGWGVMA